MKLTAKGRYAVTAMLDLAMNQAEGGPVPVADIAERQALSHTFLEQLFSKLKKANLVQSVRGAKGGYRLNLPPVAIKLSDVVQAMDENTDSTQCKGAKNCKQGKACLTHHLWERLNDVTHDFLHSITLADLAAGKYPTIKVTSND